MASPKAASFYNAVNADNNDTNEIDYSSDEVEENDNDLDCAERISLGTFDFVPLPGFQEAIDDPNFRKGRCLDVLTTLIGCDLVWSDELEEPCVDDQLPALALAAARSPFVLRQVDGDPYVDVALTLVVPAEYGKEKYLNLVNPLPAEILVASVQHDVDRDLFWEEMDKAYITKGQEPLTEEEVLRILLSDAVKLQNKSFIKRMQGFLQSSVF